VAVFGAEMLNLWTVRLLAGVAASMVTTFVLSLVIWMNEVLSGGVPPDQLVPTRHKPLVVCIQAFSA